MPTLTGIHRYPVKSCRGEALESAVVEPQGLAGDRRWMLVDAAGNSHRAELNVDAVLFPLAIVLQTVLTAGVGLLVAPLVVFFRDLERAVKLILRFLFYASPIIYGTSNLPPDLHFWAAFNPLTGIFSLYRAAFFPDQLDWFAVGVSAAMSLAFLGLGLLVFTRAERAVLKEI